MQLSLSFNLQHVVSTFRYILIALCLTRQVVKSDQGFYKTSNAVEVSDENLLLDNTPTVELIFTTPHKYLADTQDLISMYLVGDFSVSGPHTVGPFPFGDTKKSIKLLRVIGELKSVEFQTTGYDGWLLSNFNCRIGNTMYELKGEAKWLDALNPTEERLFGDAYEHNAHDSYRSLPASSKTTFEVSYSHKIYTPKGIYDQW